MCLCRVYCASKLVIVIVIVVTVVSYRSSIQKLIRSIHVQVRNFISSLVAATQLLQLHNVRFDSFGKL